MIFALYGVRAIFYNKYFEKKKNYESIKIENLINQPGKSLQKTRFLIYGFSDFIKQLDKIQFKYYITSFYPYPMIMAEFESEKDAILNVPNDLICVKYYN